MSSEYSAERQIEIEFQKLLHAVSKEVGYDVSEMGTFNFYALIEKLNDDSVSKT